MMMKKQLPWRSQNAKQAKDKAAIYNSREWQQLRIAKLRANPLCERCQAEGYIKAAQCVHHIHPIEESSSMQEMRHWAFMWSNLQSLCYDCHARVHKELGSNTKETVQERREQRHQRWVEQMKNKFLNTNDNGIQHQEHDGIPPQG